MYIGLGIVLLVAGGILSFDVITLDIQHVNDGALGAVLMGGGLLAIILSFVMTDRYRGRRTMVEDTPVVEERRLR